MRRPTQVSATAALAAGLCLAVPARLHAAAVANPTPGMYVATGLYSAVVASGGAQCPSPGTTVTLQLVYPGPAKSGAAFHETELTGGAFAIFSGRFPVTPAAGVTSWSGTVAEASSSGLSQSASFTATLQFYDVNSFLATFDWTEAEAGGGTCQETIAFTLIKSGQL